MQSKFMVEEEDVRWVRATAYLNHQDYKYTDIPCRTMFGAVVYWLRKLWGV